MPRKCSSERNDAYICIIIGYILKKILPGCILKKPDNGNKITGMKK